MSAKIPSRFSWLCCGGFTTYVGVTGEVFIWHVGTVGRWAAAALYTVLLAASLWLDHLAQQRERSEPQ